MNTRGSRTSFPVFVAKGSAREPFRIDLSGATEDRARVVGPYASYLVETFVTLIVVCGLAFLVLYGARRLGVGRAQGAIKLVGQLPLDARRSVYLIKVAEQVFVVGVGEAGFTKLGEMAAKDLPPQDAEPDAFAKVLARFRKPAPGVAEATEPEGDE